MSEVIEVTIGSDVIATVLPESAVDATTVAALAAEVSRATTAEATKVPTSRLVAGHPLTGDVTIVKADVGLGNVDNTSDVNKPVSTAQQTALNGKADLSGPGATVPRNQLPNISGSFWQQVANQAAMLALTAPDADTALVVFRTDTPGTVWFLNPGLNPATLGNWGSYQDDAAGAAAAAQTAAQTFATSAVATQHTTDNGLYAPITTTTIDLVDRTNNTTETVPAGTTTNCSTAGVTKTAPALAGSVGTPPLRFAVKNLSTGNITVAYPDQGGVAQSLALLPAETRTFRQKSTSGWGVESGAVAVATLDARFVAKDTLVRSVMDHGAVGNGSTDDTAAIQTLLTAVGAAGGGTVFFPPGTYQITGGQQLSVPSNVILQGAGRRASYIRAAVTTATETNYPVKVDTGVSNVTIRALGFLGAGTTGTAAAAAVRFNGATDCLVDRCYIDNKFGWGVFISASSRRVLVQDTYIAGTVWSHCVEINDSSYCKVSRCHLISAGNGSTSSQGVENYQKTAGEQYGNEISDCLIDTPNGSGIANFGDVGTLVRGNVIRNPGLYGIYAIQSEVLGSGYPSTDGVCANNVITGANAGLTGGGSGIGLVVSAARWTCTGNSVTGTQGNASGVGSAGIMVDGVNNTVTGNNVSLNWCGGIYVNSTATRTTVTGNQVLDNSVVGAGSRDGINVSANYCTVVGNNSMDTRGTKKQRFGVRVNSGATGCMVIGNTGLFGQGNFTVSDAGTQTIKIGNETDNPPTSVTGSRGGNAALASLLTALAAQGLITDSSSA